MFEIRKNAAEKIKEAIKGAPEGSFLRISIEKGCCHDNLNIELTSQKNDDDIEMESEGMKFYISKEASATLDKAYMDADEKGDIFVQGLGPRPRGGCSDHSLGHNDSHEGGCCGGDGGCCGN